MALVAIVNLKKLEVLLLLFLLFLLPFQWRDERTAAAMLLSAPMKNPMEKKSIFHGHLLGLVATRDLSYALMGVGPHQTRKQGDAAAGKHSNPAGNVSRISQMY